jgi:hypothetical protein
MKLNFTFTVDEANAILKALSHLPYEQVFQMIHSIQAQAAPQVAELEANAPKELGAQNTAAVPNVESQS